MPCEIQRVGRNLAHARPRERNPEITLSGILTSFSHTTSLAGGLQSTSHSKYTSRPSVMGWAPRFAPRRSFTRGASVDDGRYTITDSEEQDRKKRKAEGKEGIEERGRRKEAEEEEIKCWRRGKDERRENK